MRRGVLGLQAEAVYRGDVVLGKRPERAERAAGEVERLHENLGTDPATAQAICIIFACYSRIMRHFKMDTLGTDIVSGQESAVRCQWSWSVGEWGREGAGELEN